MTQRWRTILGWVLVAATAVFFAADGLVALLKPAMLQGAMAETGFPAATVPIIGILALGPALLLLVPPTAVLGAILLSGFIGGALCAHVRINSSITGHELLLIGLGAAVWAGLWLRDQRVRALLPFSS